MSDQDRPTIRVGARYHDEDLGIEGEITHLFLSELERVEAADPDLVRLVVIRLDNGLLCGIACGAGDLTPTEYLLN